MNTRTIAILAAFAALAACEDRSMITRYQAAANAACACRYPACFESVAAGLATDSELAAMSEDTRKAIRPAWSQLMACAESRMELPSK